MKSAVGMTISQGLKLAHHWERQPRGGAKIALMQGIYSVQAIRPILSLTFDLSMKFRIEDGYTLLYLSEGDRIKLHDVTEALLNIVGRSIGVQNRDTFISKAQGIYLRCNGIRHAAIQPIPGYRPPPVGKGGE
jgi:hypothetical protein